MMLPRHASDELSTGNMVLLFVILALLLVLAIVLPASWKVFALGLLVPAAKITFLRKKVRDKQVTEIKQCPPTIDNKPIEPK